MLEFPIGVGKRLVSMAAQANDDKREKIKLQHTELCRDFQQHRVCPRGARCQRIHLYQDATTEQVVTMLDFVIGHLYDQSMKLSILDENIKSISTSLKLDHRSQVERGRARGGTERKRYSRQMRARSASSERARQQHKDGDYDIPTQDRPPLQVPFQHQQQPAIHSHSPLGIMYNPPQHIPPGQPVSYIPPYYHQVHIPYPTTHPHHDRQATESAP